MALVFEEVANETADGALIVARFEASFDSECDGCGFDILEGDETARTEHGDYVCKDCST